MRQVGGTMTMDESQDLEGQGSSQPDEDIVVPGAELPEEPLEDSSPEEPQRDANNEAKPQWYVVHCYSGYENKVKKNLEHRIASMGMQSRIFETIVPTEEQVELKEGQRRIVERRIYPGYVLVKMVLDEESWYAVRNTPGVTGFVGIGTKPTPLRQEEVDRIMRRMEAEEPVAQVKVKAGDRVRIVEGSFIDFNGVVDEVYPDKGKARVLVSFFNRETPIEVDLLQIERL
jgi:transcription termination/antitermination protein NusG